MALQGIQPVQPRPAKQKTRTGDATKILKPVGQALGAIGGGLAAAATTPFTGPLGLAAAGTLGAASGAQAGGGLGAFLGEKITPTRTITEQPQAAPPIQNLQSLSQQYKMTDNGRLMLEGLAIAQSDPDLQEFAKPLGTAIMQDIAQNNPRRRV